MSPKWNTKPPSDDSGYFDQLSRSLFTAGLNWGMIEKKWPNFRKAFLGFDPQKVSGFVERDINRLMEDEGIVRNEKKVRATVSNAKQFLRIRKEHGSFKKYIDSFGREEDKLQEALREHFEHVGPSTARTFLWSVGYKLTPNAEEKKWMASHHM
ncbi:MAG: DNA-3-methyladenine glycosylase I [Thaumarchaeota archaeon]|nr:DNA-3-methyladenine glycosylase I [Nitrososphaerota archaeon]